MIRKYASLILLFIPPILFLVLLILYREEPSISFKSTFPFVPFQFYFIALFGAIATLGGVLDWSFHRTELQMKISKKERDAEAAALGLGGIPMFILMSTAMLSEYKDWLLIPIILILIYTVVAICYDEFVFHRVRCGKKETVYHRMLVFGNGLAWLFWFQYIYV